jgi:hypothetical protein
MAYFALSRKSMRKAMRNMDLSEYWTLQATCQQVAVHGWRYPAPAFAPFRLIAAASTLAAGA